MPLSRVFDKLSPCTHTRSDNGRMTASSSAPIIGVRRAGRGRTTSRAELSRIGLELFIERGFEAVTIDDIAEAAGIGRRTFFRYFPSKNDLPWGEFDLLLAEMRTHLMDTPADVPMFDAIRNATMIFNTYSDSELAFHRERMKLLFTVPALAAHSTLRYRAWRDVLAEFVGRRLDQDPSELAPQAIGWAFLAASLAGYEQWLASPSASLTDTLAAAHNIVGDIARL